MSPGVGRAEPGVPDPPNELIPDRGVGAIAAADRDFVVKVRLAGLWEIPAGGLAQDRSQNDRIKSVGRDIADQHRELDRLVVEAARKLGVSLPDEPNADQQGWLNEMRNSRGTQFDQIYIDRLRAAHGKIFPAIATIRASTRNDTVRKLAQRANQFVMTHMTLLESSGIVNFAALPTAPPPSPAAAGGANAGARAGGVGSTRVRPASVISGVPPNVNTTLLIVMAMAGVGLVVLVGSRMVRRGARVRRYRSPRHSD
ncbi:hypothetical protein GCM10010123_14340 [Pilimelia anulata]|uniref:DUF4142 domain-containing protein n=1 Tax=Pilimelia anulata TaxID=53371 RepID=A0A8J3B1L6_9ACTN|nr:hypothetical protein GCM10010123_14340 [Pilimelia anulata]